MKMIQLRNWSVGIACAVLFAVLLQNGLLEWKIVRILGMMVIGLAVSSSILSARWLNPFHSYNEFAGRPSPGPWLIKAILPVLDAVVIEIPGVTEPQILRCGPSSTERFVVVMKYVKANTNVTVIIDKPLEVGAYYIFDDDEIRKISPGQVKEWV